MSSLCTTRIQRFVFSTLLIWASIHTSFCREAISSQGKRPNSYEPRRQLESDNTTRPNTQLHLPHLLNTPHPPPPSPTPPDSTMESAYTAYTALHNRLSTIYASAPRCIHTPSFFSAKDGVCKSGFTAIVTAQGACNKACESAPSDAAYLQRIECYCQVFAGDGRDSEFKRRFWECFEGSGCGEE